MDVPCVDEINPCGSEFAHRDCRFHYKSARRVYKTVWSSNGRHKTPVPWRVEQVSHTLSCVKQLCYFINCWVRHCWYFLSISLFPQVSCNDVYFHDTQSAAFKVLFYYTIFLGSTVFCYFIVGSHHIFRTGLIRRQASSESSRSYPVMAWKLWMTLTGLWQPNFDTKCGSCIHTASFLKHT